ncbi:TetR/AcrR family transcriptional regulator [Nocardiopsis sp. EMB25]|uniref:TetR/AcrR family transcriptional regulator n=1 Tax=Nocardiopsis sp. EMB25 TaxID=2835867 RepID=UPI0022846D90|nr:TetR/AcrR family transcriptional regulator [Nocardiopsis sp. EMB25]MCY9784101.1 TetR/AcrR family transcriptional regulator [Nocardiopsis sp. EMB25]
MRHLTTTAGGQRRLRFLPDLKAEASSEENGDAGEDGGDVVVTERLRSGDDQVGVRGPGVGERVHGDRTGLIHALYETRLEPIRTAVEEGPPPLGPDAPPQQRVPALLDAVLCFKIDHRHLALALEGTGGDSPYQAEHYERWHGTLRDLLERVPGFGDGDFTAHALLAATRADLVEHLVGQRHTSRERMRAQLAALTARILAPGN